MRLVVADLRRGCAVLEEVARERMAKGGGWGRPSFQSASATNTTTTSLSTETIMCLSS